MPSQVEILTKYTPQQLLQKIDKGGKLSESELAFLIDNYTEEEIELDVFTHSVKSKAIVNLQGRYFAIEYTFYPIQSRPNTYPNQPYEVAPVQEIRWVWEPKDKKIDEED